MWRKSRLQIFLVVYLLLDAAVAQQLTVVTPEKQTVLSRSEIEALPHVKITAPASHNSDTVATFEGIPLQTLLEKAGVTFGDSLRGKRLACYLMIEASDGYRVVVALPEIDHAFTDKQIILVFLKDGKPLDAKEGPYRVVIPGEKRMARWVRQVTTLRIVDAP